MRVFCWKMCFVEAGSATSQATHTPTSTMVSSRLINTLAAGLV